MTVPDQETLIRRAQYGDANAFETLVKAYYPSILNYCYRSLGSRFDAEDVTQDVFVKAARKLQELSRHAAFKGWLYAIAHSSCNDLFRRRRRQLDREQIYHQAQAMGHPEVPTDPTLWHLVAELPPKLKEALILVYWEGLSHAEAAAILHCAESTVSWRIHQAKKQLRARMEVCR